MIDKATVDQILDSVDIVDVVSDFVTLKRRGTNYVGLCPFHNDRTPSFYVSRSKGICKCFSCGQGGSAVNFIMQHEQLSYYETLKYLAAKYHIEVKEKELTDEEKEAQTVREGMLMVNEWACNFFEQQLHETTEGQEIGLSYFKERGFSTETIKKFRLGYCPEGGRALYNAAIAKGFNKKILFDTGLCVDDNHGGGYDRYRGRVIFPIINVAGKVVAFGGRILKNDKTKAKYVNSPESIIYSKRNELYGLYNAKREINKKDKCYIVEGYADVISMHQSGFENVIASSGTALTENHIQRIHRFTENVTELFDGDEAGIRASLKGIDKLLSQGLNIKVLLLPDNDDPDSYARQHSASEIQQYIDENENDFISFKSKILLRGVEHDPIAKSNAIKEVVKSISVIPNDITRAVYAKECSNLFGINEETILRDIEHYRKINKDEAYKQKEKNQGEHENSQPDNGDPTLNNPDNKVEIKEKDSRPKPDTQAAVYDQEQAVIKYVIKYGMCYLCGTNYGNDAPLQTTVVEYINEELQMDSMQFSIPIFAKIFNIALDYLKEFYHDFAIESPKIDKRCQELCTKQIRDIDPTGHNTDSLQQEEAKIKSSMAARAIQEKTEYCILYLEKKLCSHPDQDVRDMATELAVDKYQLSKIHTKYAHIPTDFDRIETLLPESLNNWKNALIVKQINQLQNQLKQASPDDNTSNIMQQLQDLYSLRKQLAKLIGERVVNPK